MTECLGIFSFNQGGGRMSNSTTRSIEFNIALVSTAGEIMVAMIQNSKVPSGDIHLHLQNIMSALSQGATPGSPAASRQGEPAGGSAGARQGASETKQTSVAISQSIKPDYLVCFEDGQRFKTLKRHLRQKYNMTPEAYRQKWGLPDDYPMVAPNYSAARSSIASKSSLGKHARGKPKTRKTARASTRQKASAR